MLEALQETGAAALAAWPVEELQALQGRQQNAALGTLELDRGWPGLFEFRQSFAQRGIELVDGLAGSGGGADRHHAGQLIRVLVGTDFGGKLLLDDERLVEARRLAARQNRHRHV